MPTIEEILASNRTDRATLDQLSEFIPPANHTPWSSPPELITESEALARLAFHESTPGNPAFGAWFRERVPASASRPGGQLLYLATAVDQLKAAINAVDNLKGGGASQSAGS